jgi:phosphate:Na+ symporter
MSEIVLSILAGLVLFLFAVTQLSRHLEHVLGVQARKRLELLTRNTLSGILTGAVATTVLGSSSAVIIIAIVLINSKVLSLRNGMGVVLGANIGTTVSSQIIAMDVGKYSPVFLLIGFVMLFVSRSSKIGSIGKTILYFGVLFFGLFTMEKAVEPLKEEPIFSLWMKRTETPYLGALIGAGVTVIIQSSSATVGMAIILVKKGFLTMGGGIALMLGAELGTCSDTLLATINGSRPALKTGLFHLLFNTLTIALGLAFFGPFVDLVEMVSRDAPLERAVANAHMLFNLLGVVAFAWSLPLMERLLNKWLPDIPLRPEDLSTSRELLPETSSRLTE